MDVEENQMMLVNFFEEPECALVVVVLWCGFGTRLHFFLWRNTGNNCLVLASCNWLQLSETHSHAN